MLERGAAESNVLTVPRGMVSSASTSRPCLGRQEGAGRPRLIARAQKEASQRRGPERRSQNLVWR